MSRHGCSSFKTRTSAVTYTQSPFDDSHPVESRFKNSADGETEDVFPDCVARKTEQVNAITRQCGVAGALYSQLEVKLSSKGGSIEYRS